MLLYSLPTSFQLPLPVWIYVSRSGAIEEFIEKMDLIFLQPLMLLVHIDYVYLLKVLLPIPSSEFFSTSATFLCRITTELGFVHTLMVIALLPSTISVWSGLEPFV